jgi:Cellulase M and related proteins
VSDTISAARSPLGPGAEARLREHLEALLPLRNPARDPDHAVIRYARDALRGMGRRVWRDALGNLYAPGCQAEAGAGGPPGPRRAVVAHTDSVLQMLGEDVEPFSLEGGVYRSRYGRRPLGGDDKCGVAVALTLAEAMPEVGCVLTADEEIGYVGALRLALPPHDFLVQCDRRGSGQFVHTMRLTAACQVCVLSEQAVEAVQALLPHSEGLAGGGTDAGVLVGRGLARNAVNLATGYHEPHTRDEYVVWDQLASALRDAAVLLRHLPPHLPPAHPRTTV